MTLARSARKPRFWMALLAAPLALGLWTLPTPHAWADAESSKEYYQDALDWLNKGDFRAAVIQLRNALQEDPENHSARQLLGRLYLEAGNLNAALKELEYVHNAQPTDETEVFVGRALLGLRQYQDVLDTVRAQADDPKFSDAKSLIRAEALFALNRLDAAAKLVQPFLSREQTSVPASLLMARIEARRGNSEQADDYIDATLVAQPDLIDAHILRAQIALQARDLDRVLQMADKIEEIAPDDPRAKLMRAEALVRKNELEEAEAVLAAFVKDYPEATSAIYLHARVLMLLSRYQEADAELLKLPAEVRTQPAASLVIGLVKYQLEQFAQAEEALQRFVAAAGERGRQARRLLASIQLQTARPAAALETLEPLTGSGSGDVAALQLAASAAVRVGDLDTAQRHLQRVTQVGAPDDRRQAVTFLRVLANGQRDENGKLMLDPIALGVLRALDLAQFGDSDAALKKAQELQAEESGDPGVANLLARLHVARGELAEARAALEPILAENPTHIASISNMNRVDISEGNFDEVEARLREAIEQAPTNENLILQLAQFLANRGERVTAVDLLEEKAGTLPDSLALRNNLININLRQGNLEAVRQWADEAKRIGLETNQNGLRIAGEAYIALEDHEAAVDAYQALAAAEPGNPDTLLKLAETQFLAGDAASSKATLEEILAREPTHLGANRALISMHLAEQDETAALAVADQAGAENPVVGSVLRANVYRSLGEFDKAVAELQARMEESPSIALVQQTYGMLTAAGRRDEAEALLASWLGDNPDDVGILQLLSAQYIQDQRMEEASILLERAYALQPNNVIVLNNLAWLRYELERPGAMQLARRAYRMAPNTPAIVDTLGWIMVREGDVEEGLKLLYAAADAAPDSGDIAYHVAYALHRTGKTQEAIDLMTRTLAADIPEQSFTEREKAEALLEEMREG